LRTAGVKAPVAQFDSVSSAYNAALMMAAPADRIVVFGSFYMVGDIIARAG
jgi:folylpolyglutamate synthase/dihydropteroate synthase